MLTKEEQELLRESCRGNKEGETRSPQEVFTPQEAREFLEEGEE